MNDTHPRIQRFIIDGYRAMPPWQKLRQVDELTVAVQQMALARIRKDHPHASEREQRLRLASLWLDRDTMIRAFGWDPKKEGY